MTVTVTLTAVRRTTAAVGGNHSMSRDEKELKGRVVDAEGQQRGSDSAESAARGGGEDEVVPPCCAATLPGPCSTGRGGGWGGWRSERPLGGLWGCG